MSHADVKQNIESTAALVTLHFACKKLPNLDGRFSLTDAYILVSVREEGEADWVSVGRTETVTDDLDPVFKDVVTINYWFEKEQYVKFEVMNENSLTESDIVGFAETSVANMMKKKTFTIKLEFPGTDAHSRGKLIIHATSEGDCNDEVNTEITACA